MQDHIRKTLPLQAVSVSETNNGEEFYRVGFAGVTKIEWSETSGHMASLLTIQVWKDNKLHSEHPFSNVLGVYYAKGEHHD